MKDGSRQFAALPESCAWSDLRNHLGKLPGVRLGEYLTDAVTEAWIDFANSILKVHAEAQRESEREVQRILATGAEAADGKRQSYQGGKHWQLHRCQRRASIRPTAAAASATCPWHGADRISRCAGPWQART